MLGRSRKGDHHIAVWWDLFYPAGKYLDIPYIRYPNGSYDCMNRERFIFPDFQRCERFVREPGSVHCDSVIGWVISPTAGRYFGKRRGAYQSSV